jgi:hypothetical protein
MYLFVSGATKTVNQILESNSLESKYLGKYLTPRANCNKKYLDLTINQRCLFGADNDCFKGFNREKYEKMIELLPRTNKLKYVTIPDVVGDYEETIKLFDKWHPILKNEKLPLAFVLQDDMPISEIPFDKISSIFIGGGTEYKFSEDVVNIVKLAKEKNKWVHMGRVNSAKRITYANKIGCNSIDGTSFSMFPNTYILNALKLLDKLNSDKDYEQLCFFKLG